VDQPAVHCPAFRRPLTDAAGSAMLAPAPGGPV